MEEQLAFRARLSADFDTAVAQTTAALGDEGFGVLTRIDVHTTLAEKLGVEVPRYTILGACKPPLAHQALQADAEVGLLLPCNVTVAEEPGGGAKVAIARPTAILGDLGSAAVSDVAAQAEQSLARVAERLTAQAAAT